MSDTKDEAEWLEALDVEEETDETDATDASGDEGDEDSGQSDSGQSDDDSGDDEQAEEEGDSPGDKSPEGDDAAEQREPETPAEETPTPLTKEALREALQEVDSERSQRIEQVSQLKKEVLETLYPEGVSRQLKDSDGDPITSIDDLTGLINPKTNDYFTEEEAGAYLLSHQQKLNQDIEQMERFAEEVAEVNLGLQEGVQRVQSKYGAILGADEKLSNELLLAYDQTLIKDPNTGVIIKAPLDVEKFFDIALEPRLAQLDQEVQDAEKAEAEAKKAAEEAAKRAQGERGDLPPSGKEDVIAPEDKEWAQAYKDYEEGI